MGRVSIQDGSPQEDQAQDRYAHTKGEVRIMEYECEWCDLRWTAVDPDIGHFCPQCLNPGVRANLSDDEWQRLAIN
jgi:hypothetical protein